MFILGMRHQSKVKTRGDEVAPFLDGGRGLQVRRDPLSKEVEADAGGGQVLAAAEKTQVKNRRS